VFDFMKNKQCLVHGNNECSAKEELLFETIKFYSEKKKALLGEDFETKKIFEMAEKYKKSTNEKNNVLAISADDEFEGISNKNDCSLSNSSDTHDSDTESEYAFSSANEDDTQKVNRVMACAKISLRRAQQSKTGIYLNKRTSS